MRLWHYKLIPYLPNKQLVSQWRELNAIFKSQIRFILTDYVYEYPKEDLCLYSDMVLYEMKKRGFKANTTNMDKYFPLPLSPECEVPFKNHHTDRYLKQCFYNLQEKYDRGQKDFSKEIYEKLEEFIITL